MPCNEFYELTVRCLTFDDLRNCPGLGTNTFIHGIAIDIK